MDCWQSVDTTESGQPQLRSGERDVFMDKAVGLYIGKFRVEKRQKGRAFLTTERIIYIDDEDPRSYSLALELKDIQRISYSAKFWKRSAKLILFLDSSRPPRGEIQSVESATIYKWTCPICNSTNRYQGVLDPKATELPDCNTCGVPLDFDLAKETISLEGSVSKECPACTFMNHSDLLECEICGTKLLPTKKHSKNLSRLRYPIKLEGHGNHNDTSDGSNYIQLSFRSSDGLLFAEAADKVLRNYKNKDSDSGYNQNVASINGEYTESADVLKVVPISKTGFIKPGIMGLEDSKESQLLTNDIVFNQSLLDLNKLMALAETIERLYNGNSKTTKDSRKPGLLIDREKFLNKDLFVDEIAREIYEFVLTDLRSQDSQNHFIVTLVDLYAIYNKSVRIGSGLISPQEMREACERFGALNLNDLELVKINNRVLCLETKNSREYAKNQVLEITEKHPGQHILKLLQTMDKNKNGIWTLGVISEVIESCVSEGYILIDEHVSGVYYYRNTIWETGI